ncbi:MAG TPA: hypothetical protein VH561_09065 [Micromonosporaceae bacterium]|jgi:hypothetical protein
MRKKYAVIGLAVLAAFGIACGAGSTKSPSPGSSAQPSEGAGQSIDIPAATAAATSQTTQPPSLPADQVFQGRGDKVVKLKLDTDYVHIAKITHSGSSNFAVWSLDADGSNLDLLVNEIGSYTGVRPIDIRDTPAALKIEADGSWKITIQVAQKAPRWTGNKSGTGSAVLLVDPAAASGMTTIKITHTGSSNFAVWVYGANDADLLVNEIGHYSGETILPSWAVLLEIEADGKWTVTKT